MNNSPRKPFRLITIPVSHYCEKARWALDRLNLDYIEEAHTPPLHRIANRIYDGGNTTPVLVTETMTLSDSTEILQYLNQQVPPQAKLYPDDPQLRQQVEELEDLFDKELGPATRRWAYFHLLDHQKLMQKMWCASVPTIERLLFPFLFALMRSRLPKYFNITAETAASSYQTMQKIFQMVEERLADGRPYLAGDRFWAADLTFACLAAPAVCPPEYRGSFPPLEEVPNSLVSQIIAFRETPAGQFVLRLFREERQVILGAE